MPAKRFPHPYVEPEATGQAVLDIEVVAEQRASDWGARDDKNLDEVCKNAGVDIEYSRKPNEIMLEVPLEGRPIIWLPRSGRKRDDRVIIATALGHWALHIENARNTHPGCGIQALYEPTTDGAREEAIAFGLAFLMPTEEFMECWSAGKSQAVSDRFDVPTRVTYLRANSLDLGEVA